MTKGTSAFRRGFSRVATRTASSPGYRQSAPAKAASILRRVLQKEVATSASATRQVPNSVVKAEHLFSRASANSQSVFSPVPSYGMVNRKRKDKSYGETNRRGRSYGSSHGPKRKHGDRGVRSYGTRHVIRSRRRHVRSYGTRRVDSYGERRLFSYGDRHRRKACWVEKGYASPNESSNTAGATAAAGTESGSGSPTRNCYRLVLGRCGWQVIFSIHFRATSISAICQRF